MKEIGNCKIAKPECLSDIQKRSNICKCMCCFSPDLLKVQQREETKYVLVVGGNSVA